MAEGDLSARIAEKGRGEFNQLAGSFNRMVVELQRTDQMRRNLTADVAHELRTPLHIIQGNLEGVLDNVYLPTAEHIRKTLEETRLLGRLVDDLGTLSLAESGQMRLTKEHIDIGEFLSEVAMAFSGRAEAAGVHLTAGPVPGGALSPSRCGTVAAGRREPGGQCAAAHEARRDRHASGRANT